MLVDKNDLKVMEKNKEKKYEKQFSETVFLIRLIKRVNMTDVVRVKFYSFSLVQQFVDKLH